MGAAVAAFLYGVGASAGVGLTAVALLGSVAQIAIINFTLGTLSKAIGQKGAQGKPAPINVTIRGSAENRRLVFGTVRAGGVVVYYNSAGTNKQFLYYVIAYAGHQVSAIKDIWLDNTKILHANINAGTGAVTQGDYTGKLSIWRYTGTSTQTADATLTSAFSGTWTSSFKLQGIAYAVLRMERDDKAFPSGAPQAITALLDGALMYDPRLDTTNGGSGSHRYTDATTWTFPTNPSPALALRWYLTGGSVTNTVATPQVMYGPRELNSRMNDAFFTAAANKCDEVLTGAYTTPAGDQYRYSFNMECTTGQSRREIIEAMLSAMAGVCPLVNGKWRPYAGAYDSPTHALTDADVFGDIEIIDTSDNEDRYNAVSASFRDSANVYVEATTILRTDSTYETQDNSERIPKQIQLPGVVTDPAAQRLTEIEKRKSRLMRVVKIPGGLNLLKIAPYETFTFTNTKYGWTNRVFRLLERQFDFGEEAGRVVVTARVEDSAVYTDMLTADYNNANTHTPISNVELPDAVTSLTAASGIACIKFSVSLPAYMDENSAVQLYEYTSSTPFASATLVATFRGSVYVFPKLDTTTRYYWAVIKNFASLQSSVEYPTSSAGVAGTALAATKVYTDSQSSVTITDQIHSPNPSYTVVCTKTFTPEVDCKVECTLSGSFSYSPAGSSEVSDGFFCSNGATFSTRIKQNPSGSAGSKYSVNRAATFDVLGGASTTIYWGMEKFGAGDTLTVEFADMRITELRS
jgi:hypothetical protein